MIKINLFGGPGSGKSTVAAEVYHQLKLLKVNTELVREFAKDLVYQGKNMAIATPDEQLVVFVEQLKREMILKGQVEVAICDSPLYLNAFYSNQEPLWEVSHRNAGPNDLNVFIERNLDEGFENVGRSHNQEESMRIDGIMKDALNDHGINIISISGDSYKKLK